jgi:hypothetical protein
LDFFFRELLERFTLGSFGLVVLCRFFFPLVDDPAVRFPPRFLGATTGSFAETTVDSFPECTPWFVGLSDAFAVLTGTFSVAGFTEVAGSILEKLLEVSVRSSRSWPHVRLLGAGGLLFLLS